MVRFSALVLTVAAAALAASPAHAQPAGCRTALGGPTSVPHHYANGETYSFTDPHGQTHSWTCINGTWVATLAALAPPEEPPMR
jgi:hypothetical protein